jgi:hypothetical protein
MKLKVSNLKVHQGGLAAAFLLAAVMAAGCSGGSRAPVAADFEPGLKAYLASRGHICLAKRQWPVDVTPIEFTGHARNGIQMPALERLGLVASSDAQVKIKDDDGVEQTVDVKRYALTEEGRKYYLDNVDHYKAPDHSDAVSGDLCAASVTLDKVDSWTPVKTSGEVQETTVSYTYKIDAAPWAKDQIARDAFPVVANLIDGAGKAHLEVDFVRTQDGWKAHDGVNN